MTGWIFVRRMAAATALLILGAIGTTPAAAQVDPYVGQVMLTGATFCPRGTTEANGAILPIAQNTALFSLLGTNYGGNGTSTFALPDLRGRVPIGVGQGPGLPDYNQGEQGGAVSTTLTLQNLPSHTHAATGTLSASAQPGTTASPGGNSLAASTGGTFIYRSRGSPDQALNPGSVTIAVQNAGGSQPIDNRTPYLTMRWCIALVGVFPPRN